MKYRFYILHCGGYQSEHVVPGTNERLARRALWDSLTTEQQDAVVEMDCIDVENDEETLP